MGIDNKLNKLKLTKEEIKDALNIQGFSDEEIGNIYSKYPELVRTSGNNDLPLWFKDSIVCWYDVPRLHCTNENMKNFNKLLDYSGNGLDMDLHNFAWEGMSGIGGYPINITKTYILPAINYIFKGENIINITEIKDINYWFSSYKKNNSYIPSYRIKILGIEKNNIIIRFLYRKNKEIVEYNINTDGIILIPESEEFISDKDSVGWSYSCLNYIGKCDITIEFLPLYPNALVFDGIDDYGVCDNVPLLTDYTAIVYKHTYIKPKSEVYFISKSNKYLRGAFILGDLLACSFGQNNYLNDISKNFIYLSTLSRNGLSIIPGNDKTIDDPILYLGTIRKNDNRFYKGVIYQALLFNRTLTQDEIDFVKYEIMGEELPKPVAAWSAKGKTNEDADKNILKDLTGNGHDITLNNFNWEGMSGYGGYYLREFKYWGFNLQEGYIQYKNTLSISKISLINLALCFITPDNILTKVSFKVSNLPENIQMWFGRSGKDMFYKLKNGINKIKIEPYSPGAVGLCFDKVIDLCDITIEILPEYPDGLCFDGVDDCGVCDNMPIFTLDRGYTVIAKRKPLVDSSQKGHYCFLSRRIYGGGTIEEYGSFLIEKSERRNNSEVPMTFSFGNIENNIEKFNLNTILFQTSNLYNNQNINKGLVPKDSNLKLLLGSGLYNEIQDSFSEFWKGVFYSAYIFDHDLTPYEIRKFTRLNIDREYELPEVEELPVLTYFTLDKSKLDIDKLQ